MVFTNCLLAGFEHAYRRSYRISLVAILTLSMAGVVSARDADHVLNLWTGTPPGPEREVGEEQDTSGPGSNKVAGKPVIRLGNVSVPQAHVYLAPEGNRSGAAVVICPGGGYSILAWDLEGTEVAEWLNSIGVHAVVVKYRVPTGKLDPKWRAPVQDAQRAISLLRSHSADWKVDGDKVAVLGFSAGGDTAARTALATQRLYDATDDADQNSCRPNAGILIYPAYLTNEERTGLKEDVVVTEETPPMFLAHAYDDRVTPESSLYLALALKKQGIPAELHLYDTGGHGYGLRHVDAHPVTTWNLRCGDWLRRNGWLKADR